MNRIKIATIALLCAASLSANTYDAGDEHDDGRDHSHDHDDRFDLPVVPEASTYTAVIVIGFALIGFAMWKHYQNRNGGAR